MDFTKLNGYNVKDKQARDSINEINTNIETMNEAITELSTGNNKQGGIIIIGDSYSAIDEASVSSRGGADTWVTKFSRIMNKTCYNYSEGGAGFYKKSVVDGKNNNFYEQLSLAANDSSFENSSISEIIVYGGINDMNDGVTMEQLTSSLNTLKSLYDAHFPNARFHVFAFNNGSQVIDEDYRYTSIKINYVNEFLKLCSDRGFITHKTMSWLDGDTSVWENALHPNHAGIERITNFMVQALCGGDGLEIKLTPTKLRLVTSDGTFEVDTNHYAFDKQGLTFNPFTGRLKGNIICNLSGSNNIEGNFGGGYHILFDKNINIPHSLPVYNCNDKLNINTKSYIFNEDSVVYAGIDFYNLASTQQMGWFNIAVDNDIM